MTQLTQHFTLEEFIASSTASALRIDNSPNNEIVARLTTLATTMESVRASCGSNPVYISSGYRCPELNAAVGGASSSAHLFGCACDFTIPNYDDVPAICKHLQSQMAQLHIDQLIDESGGGAAWVHLGLSVPPWEKPRLMCLTISPAGTTTGFA